jgi:hypothetical protein
MARRPFVVRRDNGRAGLPRYLRLTFVNRPCALRIPFGIHYIPENPEEKA